MLRVSALTAIVFVSGLDAFSVSNSVHRALQLRSSPGSHSSVCMQADVPKVDRRNALLLTTAATVGAFLAPSKDAKAAGLAFGYGANENEINAQLQAYSLPPMEMVPSGFKPLIQAIGGTAAANIDGSKVVDSIGSYVTSNGGLKSGERVLVLFNYPSNWVVSLPITTANGESGTVSANNYVKGDSAVVTAKAVVGSEDLSTLPKEFYQDLLLQSVPKDQWQSFKIVKTNPGKTADGADCMAVEYRYDLITSGPIVGRHGFAKCVRSGNLVIALGVNTVDTRFKGMKDSLIATAGSFRANVVKAEFTKGDAARGAGSPAS